VLLVVLVLGSALTVWLILRSDAKAKPKGASPCSATSGSPGSIKLRVLNATPREGLAASVAADLRKRGFTVTAVGNDTQKVTAPAEIRYGTKGAPAARVVAGVVTGATSRNDGRAGPDVDLILGTKFKALAPAKAGASGASCPATAKPTGSPRRT